MTRTDRLSHLVAGSRSVHPQAWQGKVSPWLLGLVVAAGAAGSWWWAQHRTGADAPAAPAAATSGAQPGGPGGSGGRRFGGSDRPQPISVGTVRRQDVRVSVQAIGTIVAANTAVVKAKVDGELQALRFKEGQLVKAGAVLAEIDPRPFQIALAQAQGQLARDQAQLKNAQIDLERFRDLLSKDGIAKQQVDTQAALVQQLQGTVQSDQAQVDNAKLQLSYTRVVAPISGRVGLKQVDLGNIVHASDANGLLTITQVQPAFVVFAVPDTHLPRINAQLKAGTLLPVQAWDREQQHRLAEGQVSSLDNAIDTATGTIKLKAQFANADGGLYPNQFVNVRLQLDTLPDALTVPAAALLRGAQGTFVYVVNRDKTVSVRRVVAGPGDGERVSVQGGAPDALQPGDTVVTDGVDRLRDGAKVEVIVPGAADAANRAASGAQSGRHGKHSAP
ncbi:MdtA/MuxA family multidrug efflux RND transporter periplasmic adaptor subunit [Aquabacterium sp.]|uniref:MdtA/MuxA family multidrug efflux RND transporter periplasmic adaptor subunit n=1 Tax=Aquabacterium sp. TaxID=1872578 RepID=UPI0035B48BCF